jgi:hypothetical protein
MRYRRIVAIPTLALFVFTFSMQNVAWASEIHSATTAQLHQAVQTSHARVLEARQAMDRLLARPDVQNQIRHAGVAPDKVRARVAMLGDSEILRLHQQVMTPDMQQASGGLSEGAIIAIVVAAVGGFVLLAILVWYASDQTIAIY